MPTSVWKWSQLWIITIQSIVLARECRWFMLVRHTYLILWLGQLRVLLALVKSVVPQDCMLPSLESKHPGLFAEQSLRASAFPTWWRAVTWGSREGRRKRKTTWTTSSRMTTSWGNSSRKQVQWRGKKWPPFFTRGMSVRRPTLWERCLSQELYALPCRH